MTAHPPIATGDDARNSLRVLAVLSAAYVLSQFLRASVAVIAPDLAVDLSLDPEQLGALTAAFFLTFAAAQLAVGILLDSFGPARTMTGFLGLTAIGIAVFAAAQSMTGLVIGRALMGLGCSALFIGGLVVIGQRFPADRFAGRAALVMGLGYGGTVLATAPMGLIVDAVGWRGVFWGLVVYAGVLAALVPRVLGESTADAAARRHPESLTRTLRGLRQVLANPELRYLLPMQFVGYATMFSLLGLWAGPYFHDVHAMDVVARGNALVIMAVAAVAGLFCFGPLDRRFNTRKRLVILGAGANAVLLAVLAALAAPPPALAVILLALIGLFNGYSVVLITHGRAIYPDALAGRGMTVNNTVGMGGVAVFQALTGIIVGAFPATAGIAPEAAYRTVFAFLAAALVLALAVYARAPDRPPNPGSMAPARP